MTDHPRSDTPPPPGSTAEAEAKAAVASVRQPALRWKDFEPGDPDELADLRVRFMQLVGG